MFSSSHSSVNNSNPSQSPKRKLRNDHTLESKLKQMEDTSDVSHRGSSGGGYATFSPSASFDLTTRERIGDLKHQLEQVQNAYARSEERCKQLVEVTQQWALECDEKMKLVRIEEKTVQQLTGEMEQAERRVEKYKKYWMDTKDLPRGRVSDSQFEELRSEMALRRELYDQVGRKGSCM